MAAFMGKTALEAALADLDLEQEQRDAVATLDDRDLMQIDQAILSALDRSWQKAGFIASGVMIAAPDAYEELPEVVYELRIRALAQAGRIEGKGDPQVLKTYEIRLADDPRVH
ncbi:conserved hypothetical protein [Luteimonas sp. 9C]|uniref:DUF3658 domain-containing protein n=1 Tax=Luteimonas sp. 9C TaxID=2653148 RepID=UPI0012F44BD1|nr:DUF3658 domain-containing protein [Luteimonas sp. 9C]VXC15616.1 conserved hypothetical protein [Luteimonas sp. 9C]